MYTGPGCLVTQGRQGQLAESPFVLNSKVTGVILKNNLLNVFTKVVF